VDEYSARASTIATGRREQRHDHDDSDSHGTKPPPKQPPRKLKDQLVYFHEIEPATDANDFVEGLLIERGMSVIYGESNSGKTFFATDLAFHVACGWPWNGREAKQGAVLYCCLEGSHGIHNRISALKTSHLVGDDVPLVVLPVAIDMLSPYGHTDEVIEAIGEIKSRTGKAVILTVMDTLSRAMAGGNENAPDDMGALVSNGTRIQQEAETHVAWVHHCGKDQAKGARGHSLLRAATDTEIEVVSDEEGARTARVTKQRDLECEGEFPFRLKVIELGTNERGKPVTSCVVDYGTEEAPAKSVASRGPKRGTGGHAQRAKEILTDLIATAGKSGYPGVPTEILSVPEDWWREQFYQRAMPGDTPDAKQKAFKRSSNSLVETHSVGMAANRVWIVRAE
jgi:hypothetical protein